MFVKQAEARWTWPVVVRVPGEDGVVEQRFSAVWRLLPKAERDELGRTEDGTDTLLRQAVVELRDIVDEAGRPIPHSAELLDALISIPWVRSGLIRAWAEALSGLPPAAAAGN